MCRLLTVPSSFFFGISVHADGAVVYAYLCMPPHAVRFCSAYSSFGSQNRVPSPSPFPPSSSPLSAPFTNVSVGVVGVCPLFCSLLSRFSESLNSIHVFVVALLSASSMERHSPTPSSVATSARHATSGPALPFEQEQDPAEL